MITFTVPKNKPAIFRNTLRRAGWFLENLSLGKLKNIVISSLQFTSKSKNTLAWPVVLKIDISPLCNLKCTVCVHAYPSENETLKKQEFSSNQQMSVDQYRGIINEVKGKSAAVSLYYLGDPFVHPDLDEMCFLAREAGLNVHVSTNFSFPLTDDRIRRIVKSGLTHLTVCVDGLSQEKYQLTRVGGRIDRVISNLKRLCQYRSELGQLYPKIEIQYIKYQHNIHEMEEAVNLFDEIGVDQTTSFWGNLANYTDIDPGKFNILGPKQKKSLPQCFWPYFSMVIKFNGDVIPCCNYRQGMQYTSHEDPLVIGNVFKTSVWDIWNSLDYRELRRFVSNPELVKSSSSLEDSFCYGCPSIFDTDVDNKVKRGDNYKFEELYTINAKGYSVEKPRH